MSTPVAIVGCGASKRDLAHGETVPAADLYTGTLYQRRLAFARVLGGPLFIVSAQFGLLAPDYPVGRYERRIQELTRAEREGWAWDVRGDFIRRVGLDRDTVVLASGPYRAPFEALKRQGAQIGFPEPKLPIGKLLAWHKAQAERAPMDDCPGFAKDAKARTGAAADADYIESHLREWNSRETVEMTVACLRELLRRAAARKSRR